MGVLFFSFKVLAFGEKEVMNFSSPKTIFIEDNGVTYQTKTEAKNVAELLDEESIKLSPEDNLFPEKDTSLYPRMKIDIRRAMEIEIKVDGKIIHSKTLRKNVESAIGENNIRLSPLDQVSPGKNYPVQDKMTIIITRINVEEKTQEEDIDFDIETEKDSKLGWRETKIKQKGEVGIQKITYEITYKNGEEVSRKILKKEIVKDPVTEIVIQGTHIEYGKSHTGQATWYAHQGGLYAANPWLPLGSFVKVTNRANGKSVIVEINDRGPFGNGRILDLDKVAFSKIAGLGEGVIDIKMQEITN